MKKYVKPELFYEPYELSQHIADCTWELTSADKTSCTALADPDKMPTYAGMGVTLFTTDACTLLPDALEGYCYHNGTGVNNTFKS